MPEFEPRSSDCRSTALTKWATHPTSPSLQEDHVLSPLRHSICSNRMIAFEIVATVYFIKTQVSVSERILSWQFFSKTITKSYRMKQLIIKWIWKFSVERDASNYAWIRAPVFRLPVDCSKLTKYTVTFAYTYIFYIFCILNVHLHTYSNFNWSLEFHQVLSIIIYLTHPFVGIML